MSKNNGDDVRQRAVDAIEDTESGSNHGVGVDGDAPSRADRDRNDDSSDRPDHPTGHQQAAENADREAPA